MSPTGQLPPLTLRAWLRWEIVGDWVAELSPRTVLEYGCGMGAAGTRLSQGRTYVGIEPDPQSRAAAIDRLGDNGRVLADEAELEAGEVFDLVCAFEVLEHIEDDAAALRNWVSRIRPGGHLLISVPAWQKRYGPMDAQVGHFRRYDPDHLDAVLAKSGLEEERTVMYGWPLAYALEGVRNAALRRAADSFSRKPADVRSAASGRALQPTSALMGRATEVLSFPFRRVQRLQPHRGTGLIALARRR